eukprot:CAMPEP_0181221412 /NCGR_PEP_ID=MMETSP1096-20121128/29390_1 /TAXON_ID=156174 ORGANISM="Chrysochromulina ericina, Strain CCMP281" /NCGR_SAMPLE_ID=MMETSP1096 /ASSEMBLY_ACC=CAM_ASM_000453 /LENGTH=36 /DNA_ID= /DNA_START= /DNA_END= /DNA_ORIENTATION=
MPCSKRSADIEAEWDTLTHLSSLPMCVSPRPWMLKK